MKRTLLAAAAILLLLNLITIPAGHSAIRTVTGTVIKVSDGDSIQITTPEQISINFVNLLSSLESLKASKTPHFVSAFIYLYSSFPRET